MKFILFVLTQCYSLCYTSDAKMVQFCGHRLHVHSSFQLFMTTPISPTLLSPSLASQVSVINFSPSIPLAEDILLDTIFDMATKKGTEFLETTRDIASCKAEFVSLDEEMFSKLPVNGKEGCYWWSTEKIDNIVTKKNGVCSRCMLYFVIDPQKVVMALFQPAIILMQTRASISFSFTHTLLFSTFSIYLTSTHHTYDIIAYIMMYFCADTHSYNVQ